MALSDKDIRDKQFSTTRLRPGYDEEEVDEFLDEVQDEVRRLNREVASLRATLAEEVRSDAPEVTHIVQENEELRRRYDALREDLAETRRTRSARPSRAPAAGYPAQAAYPAPATAYVESAADPIGRIRTGQMSLSEAERRGVPPISMPMPPSSLPDAQYSTSELRTPEAVTAARIEGRHFGEAVVRDAIPLWLQAVRARSPRMPSDLEARLLQESKIPIDNLLHDEVRKALREGFWDALNSEQTATLGLSNIESAQRFSSAYSGTQSAPEPEIISEEGGPLFRFTFGPEEFVLVDLLDQRQTVNWTTAVTPRSFISIAGEFFLTLGSGTSVTMNVGGVLGELDVGLAVNLAVTASPAFDQSCDFIRFDSNDLTMAIQILKGTTGGLVSIFGISAVALTPEMITILMMRSASNNLFMHSQSVQNDSVISRISRLLSSDTSGAGGGT